MSVENCLPTSFVDTSFVDTLLSTDLHPSFKQTLAFALWLSVMAENYQEKFSLPEHNQLKSSP